MAKEFTFIISNDTILSPFEDGLFESQLENLYNLIISGDNFKITGIVENLTSWILLDNFYTITNVELLNNSIEVNFSLLDDINYNSIFLSWALYSENVETKLKTLICQSKNIYLLENELSTLERNSQNLTDIQQEAFSRLDNEINYVNMLIQNELVDQHAEIIVNADRSISINNENIVINRDNNSQEITFLMPRTYDGIDLATKQLYIYYIAPSKEKARPIKEKLTIDESTLLDNSKTFKTTWIFKSTATLVSGDMSFAIIAEGKNLTDSYFWQTFPATFKIHQGLFEGEYDDENVFETIPEDSRYEILLNKVAILESAYNNGELLWQRLPEIKEV